MIRDNFKFKHTHFIYIHTSYICTEIPSNVQDYMLLLFVWFHKWYSNLVQCLSPVFEHFHMVDSCFNIYWNPGLLLSFQWALNHLSKAALKVRVPFTLCCWIYNILKNTNWAEEWFGIHYLRIPFFKAIFLKFMTVENKTSWNSFGLNIYRSWMHIKLVAKEEWDYKDFVTLHSKSKKKHTKNKVK